ncbi:MAG: hypothetical protein EXR31_03815 [Betaproteobacteria bacterium]|nr:hypothetical protein [Betaproteobacteria bacterium]
MRRSDHDVSDRVRTTDFATVRSEVARLYKALYQQTSATVIERAFDEMAGIYEGGHIAYHPCDTEYHDIQHVLDVTLAMARLMDGYERSRNGFEPLSRDLFTVGVIVALFHDFGYIRKKGDHRHRYGAEYTLTHVTRGSHYLRGYLHRVNLGQYANAAGQLVHYTGYERSAETIRVSDPILRRIGHILGTADIIAQMADRCYLEKCRDRLYPEFVLGGLAHRTLPNGKVQVIFESGSDLVKKTPGFYSSAVKRLDFQLARAYDFASRHFGGQNLYVEEMQKNVRYAKVMADEGHADTLRRAPPNTLQPGVEPYPKDLVIR